MSDGGGGEALRILVVDDGRLVRETTARQLQDAGFVAQPVENGYLTLDLLKTGEWDVVLSDLRMPGMDGLELLRAIRADHADVDVIVMTAFGTVKTAVEAMQQGAADFLTKPFHFQELELRLRTLVELRGYRSQVSKLRALLDNTVATAGIIGRSPAMNEVCKLVHLFAGHTAPVLISGETGTGKEVVARAVHGLGPRTKGPFVAIPCGAIPTELAESELFGHEKGAFTGATGSRMGAFERAHHGTLLLDDVDDLPLGLQVKLLRALQEGAFTRVGGNRECAVDVRVIATTKVDLALAVAKGRFRDDVFYRLRALEIGLPPLRERGEDVLLLAQHYLRRFAAEAGRRDAVLSPEAAACLQRYSWPGNVRELRHAMEAAMTMCAGGAIALEHLPAFLRHQRGAGSAATAPVAAASDQVVTLNLEGRQSVSMPEIVDAVEQALLQWAMRRSGGQQRKASEMLGLARTTLQSKLGKSA